MTHDDPASGHPGKERTALGSSRTYWWPSWRKTTDDYVNRCLACQHTKTLTTKPAGLLQPLPVASRLWQHISADFIGPLPPSNGFNSILVVVDCFTKMAIFIGTTTNLNAQGFAKLFFEHVYAKPGLPSTLTTDRRSLFMSKCWTTLAQLIGLRHKLSSAYHPQTDGQTEIVNKALGQYLRLYTNFVQNDWADHLPHAEFCYNASPHSATSISPYAALTGYTPRKSFEQAPSDQQIGSVNAAQHAEYMHKLHKALTGAIE